MLELFTKAFSEDKHPEHFCSIEKIIKLVEKWKILRKQK